MGRGREYAGADPSQPETEALLAQGPNGSLFVLPEARRRQDSAWTWVWTIVYLANVAAGVLTFLNRNVNFMTEMSPDYLNDPSNCPAPKHNPSRSLFSLRSLSAEGYVEDSDKFVSHAAIWILISLGGAILLGILFVAMVSHSPRLLLFVALGVQVGLPLAAGSAALLNGAMGTAIPMLGLAGLLIFTFWLWREQLELVIKLLGVSGKGLRENLSLVGASILIQIGLVFMTIPLYLAIVSAATNGHVVYNTARAGMEEGDCVDEDGNTVMCCAWQTDTHVGPIVGYSLFTLLWTSMICAEIKTFTVSGTIAQWYFAPVFADAKTNRGRVGRSLRAALGPSFGSLCFGALILTAVSMLRSALEQLKENAKKNILLTCFVMLLEFILSFVEMMTKFATVRLAITGECFLDAGRNICNLLKRNVMNTFGVWWLPPLILNLSALVISLLWSSVIYFTGLSTYSSLQSGKGYAIGLAVIAFLICYLVLAFFVALLLNVVDTVYICFAMDRDRHVVNRVEIHQVFEKLPSVGPIIENPDGALAYGRPTQA